MVKVKQSNKKNNNVKTNKAAVLSLVFGLLACLILPIIGTIIAIIAGHKGRKNVKNGANGNGLSIVGLILGYASIITSLGVVFAIVLPAYDSYLERKALVEQQQIPTKTQPQTHTKKPQQNFSTTILDQAKQKVDEQEKQGHELNKIDEELTNSNKNSGWHHVSIKQGNIYATFIEKNNTKTFVLMSIKEGKNLQWFCAGDVPQSLDTYCESKNN